MNVLPHINASLNFLSAVFLSFGFFYIRRKQVGRHRFCMVSAVCSSALFLVFYLTYHFQVGHTEFREPAWVRPWYLGMLLSHILLAVVTVPLVLVTFSRALRGRIEKHRRIARWTWPIWMYVSVTGVLIYVLLYHVYPQR